MSTPGEERLQRGYRVLRRVSGGTDAPWSGTMVSTAAGGVGVLVDVELLTTHWRGWDAAASGHVLAPVDVIRRADGHDALLPVCPERVTDLLDRRASSRTPLSPGEGVTIVVSLLRGLVEVEATLAPGEDAPTVNGTWWLSDTGRPVLATDTSNDTARDATLELLAAIQAHVPELEPVLDEVIAIVRRGSVVREIDRIESTVFAAAQPAPLATTVVGPSVFGPASARAAAHDIDERSAVDTPLPRHGWMMSLARHVDAEWADTVSKATTGIWRTLRARPVRGRRRPLLAAMAVAAVVLIGGLMWPFGEDHPATAGGAQGASTASSAPPTAAGEGEGSPSEPAAVETTAQEPPDLAAVAADLLSRRSDCIDDRACLGLVQDAPGSDFPSGVIDLADEARTITLVDEFGALAVLRVDAVDDSTAAQLVVIVRVDEKWLLRDVYDVAQ